MLDIGFPCRFGGGELGGGELVAQIVGLALERAPIGDFASEQEQELPGPGGCAGFPKASGPPPATPQGQDSRPVRCPFYSPLAPGCAWPWRWKLGNRGAC